MFSRSIFFVLSVLCTISQVFASPTELVQRRDLVQDVVVLLRILRASSFCSGFAPQATVTLTSTALASTTATTSPITVLVATALQTASVTNTVTATSTITVDITVPATVTNTVTGTVTNTVTTPSTVTVNTIFTTYIVQNRPARLARRNIPKPAAIISYADAVVSSACKSYLPPPSTSTTLTKTATVVVTAVQTQLTTTTVVAATTTILTTLSVSSTVSRTITSTGTVNIAATVTASTTVASLTTTTKTTATVSHTYAVATAGTGCGDIAYYDFRQGTVITEAQCLGFCTAEANCVSVFFQCSAQEPCECLFNTAVYSQNHIQCGLPTEIYGTFTWYNKIN